METLFRESQTHKLAPKNPADISLVHIYEISQDQLAYTLLLRKLSLAGAKDNFFVSKETSSEKVFVGALNLLTSSV